MYLMNFEIKDNLPWVFSCCLSAENRGLLKESNVNKDRIVDSLLVFFYEFNYRNVYLVL
jgi:hypothetical protein